MVNVCRICKKVIETGQRVQFKVIGVYDQIPSVNSFRINKRELVLKPGTIAHADCEDEDDG